MAKPLPSCAVTKVNTARQLAHDGEVSASAHLGLEWRQFNQRLGCEAARTEVAIGAKLFAELEETLLRTHGRRWAPFRPTDRAKQDGVGLLGGLDRLIRKRVVVHIDGGLIFGHARCC